MKRNVYKSKRAHSIIKERKHTEKTSECREILPGDPAFSDHDLCTLELKKKITPQLKLAYVLLIFSFSHNIKRTIHSDLMETLADV